LCSNFAGRGARFLSTFAHRDTLLFRVGIIGMLRRPGDLDLDTAEASRAV
jgi:hypothetical protein